MLHERAREFSLLFRSGHLDGVRVARLDTWDGIAMLGSRKDITEFLAQPELETPGVYLLRKEHKNQKPRAYVGKADVPRDRIRYHHSPKGKGWWNQVVVISSGKGVLEAGQVNFLEARLVNEVRKVGRTRVENDVTPKIPRLREAAEANMNRFLRGLWEILPLIQINDFVDDTQSPVFPHQQLPKFEMKVPHQGGTAIAELDENRGKFIVKKGSHARESWEGKSSGNEHLKNLHQELLDEGKLEIGSDNICRFTEDYEFNSVSAAAKVVAGTPRHGPTTWKELGTSRTFREWQETLNKKKPSP